MGFIPSIGHSYLNVTKTIKISAYLQMYSFFEKKFCMTESEIVFLLFDIFRCNLKTSRIEIGIIILFFLEYLAYNEIECTLIVEKFCALTRDKVDSGDLNAQKVSG